MKRAFITGIAGQDGSYLAELLLERGYEVMGMDQRAMPSASGRLRLVSADLRNQESLDTVLREFQPDEIYNLAAQAFVPGSWSDPVAVAEVTGVGVLRLLESIRRHCPRARLVQASTSEMFGAAQQSPQDENTPFRPRNPYGAAKVFAHLSTVNYRESYGLFACSAISFNHESPRRAPEFVTRKVTQGAAHIKLGLKRKLTLGNLDARRDWGYAADYARGMWLMLQQEQPDDYVLATGVTHSVRELVEIAFGCVGLEWQKYVEVDPQLVRPAEECVLCGNAEKARRKLGWAPAVSFAELIQMMVRADLERQQHSLAAGTTGAAGR